MTKDTNTSKVIRGISSQTIVTIFLGIVEIVSFSIMSRLLTQDDFGYYAAITAITSIFSTFSETGIGAAIIQKKELSSRYVNNAFTISLLFGGTISLLLLLLASPLSKSVADESMKVPLMLMSISLLLNCLISVNVSILHRKLQFLKVGIIYLFSLVATTVVSVILAYKGYGYYAIITKAVLSSIITWLVSFILCKTRFSLALDEVTFKNIFSFSGWLMASTLFRNIAHQIDRLLMPRLLSVSALGSYNRPKDFVEQISSKINGIFDTALFPVLSGIQDNKHALQSAFRRSLYFMNMFALLLTTAFVFNSGLIIRIFFGSQWMELKSVMFVISCSLLFNVNGRLADCYLRSLAMTKQQFYFRVFETLIKTTGVLVAYKWGILGIALSVVITNVLVKIIKIMYVGQIMDIGKLDSINIMISSWRYSIIFLPICLMAYYFVPNSWSGDIIMAIVYCLLVLVVFLVMPDFVGKIYKEEVYSKILSRIRKHSNR